MVRAYDQEIGLEGASKSVLDQSRMEGAHVTKSPRIGGCILLFSNLLVFNYIIRFFGF